MNKLRTKASWPFWVIGAVVIVAGCGGFLGMLIPGIMSLADDMIRVNVPGETELTLDEPGTYTIFHENMTFGDGGPPQQQRGLSDFRCTLMRKADGRQIEIHSPSTSMNYSSAESAGYAVLEFTIDEPGTYILDTETDHPAVLAVARDFTGNIMRMVMTSGGVCLGAFVLAALLFVVGIVRVSRNSRIRRDQLQAAQAQAMAAQTFGPPADQSPYQNIPPGEPRA
jgi:hypothetical protein